MLERLTQTQEAARPNPWRVADAPTAYIDRLLRAIVGIENTIERLEGKHKLSQDEALADRVGTVAGLLGEQRDEAHALAGLVQTAIDAEPPERP
jgi:transcriptional regulator